MTSKKELIIFNIIWAVVFLAIGLVPLLKGHDVRGWSIITSGALLVIAALFPKLTYGFFVVWTKFGRFIGNINSKILLSVIFFVVITPMGIIIRLFGGDLLKKKIDKGADTYWEDRPAQPTSMKNQF